MERDAQNISDFELLEHFKKKRGHAEHATRDRVTPKIVEQKSSYTILWLTKRNAYVYLDIKVDKVPEMF